MRPAAPPRLRCPPRLARGARVRVVAPCGPFGRERFEAGLVCLREMGLEPVHGEDVFAREGYLAGDDARRLAELEAALDDPAAGAIWIARGGYGATRLLPRLAPERIARRPCWLVGFSDATALHARWQQAGLVSIHAANVTGLAGWSAEARAALAALLLEGAATTLAGHTVQGTAPVEGPLLGGNASLLAALVGTGALPRLGGAILVIEDVGEAPYRLDRILTQLLHSGTLDGVAGVAIGQLTDCDDRPGHEAARRGIDVARERLAVLGVPIVAGLPVGHEPDARAFALGARAVLDPAAGELRVAALSG